MSPPLLEADGVGRRHPSQADRWLLRDIGLRVEPGQRLAIVGPTGSGKSLLLRALAWLDPLDEGEVRWHGESPTGPRVVAARSRVVYLPQRPTLFGPDVEADLRAPFALRIHREAGRHLDDNVVGHWLEQLGRDASFQGQAVGTLSGGERQIVALVRALALDPEILLLDEPTAAMDAQTRQAVERLIETWQTNAVDGSRTIVWVTHDAEQLERVADDRLSLRDGRLDSEGSAHR